MLVRRLLLFFFFKTLLFGIWSVDFFILFNIVLGCLFCVISFFFGFLFEAKSQIDG